MADTSLTNSNRDIFNHSSQYTSQNCHFIRDFPDLQIPWKSRGAEYQYGIFGLNKEIRDFVAYIKPTPEEQWVRELVIARYQSAIYQLWHYCKIDVCGSFRTGLYLPTSDIDLVIFGTWPMAPLDTLKDHLEQSGLTSAIKVLSKATVPILKLTDKETGIQIDISFNMSNSIKAVNLIKEYLCIHPCLHHLVLVLKQFLFQRELNEVWTGGLGSYALIIICVSFLQHNTSPGSTIDDVNLGTLLVEFLELYGRRFNYGTTAISVRNGGSYEQKHRLFKFSTAFCIEDPLDCNNDLGRRSYAINEVKQAFEYAFVVLSASVLPHYQFLHSPLCSSILGKIIRISPDIVDHRQKICEFARKAFVNLTIQYPTLSALHPSLHQQIGQEEASPQVLVSSSDMILASAYFGNEKQDQKTTDSNKNMTETLPMKEDSSDEHEASSSSSSGAPASTSQCSSDENDEPLIVTPASHRNGLQSDYNSSTILSKPINTSSNSPVIRNSNSISSHPKDPTTPGKELNTTNKRCRRQAHISMIRRSLDYSPNNTTITNVNSKQDSASPSRKDYDPTFKSGVVNYQEDCLVVSNSSSTTTSSHNNTNSGRKHLASSNNNNNQNSYHSSSSDHQQTPQPSSQQQNQNSYNGKAARPFTRSNKRKRMNNLNQSGTNSNKRF